MSWDRDLDEEEAMMIRQGVDPEWVATYRRGREEGHRKRQEIEAQRRAVEAVRLHGDEQRRKNAAVMARYKQRQRANFYNAEF